jgi:hypothetical protein
MRRVLLFATLVSVAGCNRGPTEAERTALALVEASRSPSGIGPELVNADLVEKVRRIQLVRRTTLDTYDRAKLLEVLAGEAGPDRQYAPADRPQKQRERASRGLAATAKGVCKATQDGQVAADRVHTLTDPMKYVPSEVVAAQQDLESALHDAEAVRLDCAPGRVAVLLVKGSDGKLRVVDLWEPGAASFEVNPNDPTLK